MAYTFDKANANAASTRSTQYFEMAGQSRHLPRWLVCEYGPAVAPWISECDPSRLMSQYKWELYHLTEDYSQY